MSAMIPEQRNVATAEPLVESSIAVTSGKSNDSNGAPEWPQRMATAMLRGIGEGCQRCLEFLAARWARTGVVTVIAWPLLPPSGHTGVVAAAVAAILFSFVANGRQSLPRVAGAIRYHRRLRRIKRKWNKVIGRNAAMRKVNRLHDVTHSPFRELESVEQPVLLTGWRSFRLTRGRIRRFSPTRTPYGIRCTVDGSPIGADERGFVGELAVIYSSLGASSGRVTKNRHLAHLTDLSILFDDPFAEVVSPERLPLPEGDLGVMLGVDCDGEFLEHSLWLPTLIVGRKGSGKSRLARRMLQGLTEQGQPFLVLVFDPKGYSEELDQGQEYPWLKPVAWHYEANPGRWPEFVSVLCTMMVKQAARLGALGLSECPTRDERFPLIVAVVDELGTALDENSVTRRIPVNGSMTTVEKALRRYLRENRSGGATMIANTQVAQKQDIPIRDLFDFVICMGVNNPETVRMALGISHANEAPAHEIPVGKRWSGIGFAASSESGIRKFRGAFTSDADTDAVVARIGAWTRFYRERGHE